MSNFRVRRSHRGINLGKNFRLNFSRSGIGYSIGNRLLRYTKGANGKVTKTFNIPGTGIALVKNVGSNSKSPNNTPNNIVNYSTDSSSSYDIESLKKKLKTNSFLLKIAEVSPIIATLLMFVSLKVSLSILLLGFVVEKVISGIKYDFKIDLDDNQRIAYGGFLERINNMSDNRQLILTGIDETGDNVHRYKAIFDNYNSPVNCKYGTACIKSKYISLIFVPGYLIIYGSRAYEVIGYGDLKILSSKENFIENKDIFKDSKVVGYTNYRNKQVPVIEYGVVNFKSDKHQISLICSNSDRTY